MQQFKVGLEIHGYIDIPQKLFCNCPIDHNAPANTTICPVCTGQPGAKPMATNVQAVQKAIHIAQVLGCTVNKQLIFQRKHYSWPDSPNNYQRTISGTYAFPVGQQGMFEHIRITQCHLEEDPARWDPNTGQVDYNRCGYPLIEIVTEPDFTSLEQIRVWLEDLVTALSYIKAINKQAGIKCDVNVSIAPDYTRVEVKNVHSFSGILQAVQYEVNRLQQEGIETQHTRMWSDEQQKTIFMRSKEDAADSIFISDPDLPTIH
ncbi:MAG: Asp-tRNA(Asn)/Glu-tRNA(Gln) amidotransferase GatCAB subunit B, partial [Candidatus Woesearchaeota archaeon]